jgi:hypothetical protein
MSIKLFYRAIFECKSRPYDELWRAVDESLRDYYPEETKGWSFGTKKVKREDIYKRYQVSFGRAFTEKISISIGRDGSRDFKIVMITMHEHNIKFIDDVTRTLSNDTGYIYSVVTDYDFHSWQNAATPYSYIMANKPHEHIPRLPGQELGKDLWNERLDLSSNPGRTVFHMGYVESIGGVMYVTDKLTALTQGNLTELHQLPFLKIDDWGTCLRLELDPELLAHAENDANLCSHMDAVRAILFPQKTK